MAAVLLSADLMVVSRVQGTAAQRGAVVSSVANAMAALECCVTEHADLLLVDLTTPALDVSQLVTQLKTAMSQPPRIVAFGPHVHEARLDVARQAGCDEVVSRGQFFSQVDAILGR